MAECWHHKNKQCSHVDPKFCSKRNSKGETIACPREKEQPKIYWREIGEKGAITRSGPPGSQSYTWHAPDGRDYLVYWHGDKEGEGYAAQCYLSGESKVKNR